MIVYRLSKSKYAQSLSGQGAERFGGRWNNKGTPMVYTSGSRALCAVEVAVHTPYGQLPEDYVLITLHLPDDALRELDAQSLPPDWDRLPPAPASRKLGDAFVQDREFLALKVPSAAVPGEFNVLINPQHIRMNEVVVDAIAPFGFDQRLFGASK